MPWDLAIDPITGDFQADGAGGWRRTETADTSVLHQLVCHFDRWWADPELGSLFFDRDRFTTAPAAQVQAELVRALGRLVAIGQIADLEANATETRGGRVAARTKYRLVASGQLVDGVVPALPLGGV